MCGHADKYLCKFYTEVSPQKYINRMQPTERQPSTALL